MGDIYFIHLWSEGSCRNKLEIINEKIHNKVSERKAASWAMIYVIYKLCTRIYNFIRFHNFRDETIALLIYEQTIIQHDFETTTDSLSYQTLSS